MKYMVMECHKAYAVLMDEASRVVHAANLHYEVGQIVEAPVLLQEQEASAPRISMTVKRIAAVAACFVVMAGAGALYYHGNHVPYSSIMVCAEANIRMDVSRSGKVLSVQPLNQNAAQLLTNYECTGKDQLTVTNELIERAVESGYVQQGDTVGVYYEKDKSKNSEQFQEDVEKSLASHLLNADIHDDYDRAAEPPQPPAPVTPPVETPGPPAAPLPEKDADKPEPPAPPKDGETPALQPVTPDQEVPAPGAEPEEPAAPADPAHEHAVDPEVPQPADPPREHADDSPVPPVEHPPVSPQDSAPLPPADHPIHPPKAGTHEITPPSQETPEE